MENKYSTEEYKKIKDKEREELKNTLNQGIKDALNSERYKSFLNIMSRCHNYSFTNSLLISLQNENATLVKSFTDWKKDGVKINKNEKGIKIFCPVKQVFVEYQMDDKGRVALDENGYTVVGRYLTGSSKGLKDDEPKRILDNGLSFFPIFQETLYTDTVSKYNYNLGVSDANKAVNRAMELGIPSGTIIYFAIDFDPIDSEISSYVIPYFNGINSAIGQYKVGIYGTRNACTKVMGAGYAETCFVSDMSTGYSGNMGFKIPNNWNLDQFHEYSVTTASGSWDIDKVSYSNRFPVVSFIDMQTRVIPANVTNYHFGDVQFFKENTGEWFRVNAKKMKYRVVWESLDGTSIMPHLDVNLEKKGIGTVWREERHYNIYEYESDLMDTSTESIYRFKYFCADAGLYGEMDPRYLNAKVSIYIDTFA